MHAFNPSMKTRKLLIASSPYLFILPFVIFCLILLFYPVIYSLALSFREATVETFVSGEMPFNGLTQYRAALAGHRAGALPLALRPKLRAPRHHRGEHLDRLPVQFHLVVRGNAQHS